MHGYIKYFDDGGKYMTFVTDNEKIYDKYNEMWKVIRKLLKVKFAADPVRDDKYLVAKSKIFNKIEQHLIIIIIIFLQKEVITFVFQQ